VINNVSEEHAAFIFSIEAYPEEEDSIDFGNHLQDNTVRQPRLRQLEIRRVDRQQIGR
jgi:hypothetical protein